MRAEIIKIGNSKGLRIPKTILDQCHMKDTVNLIVEDQRLILTAYEEVREGWAKQFQLMTKEGDDHLLDSDSISHSWDDEEWQW